MPSMMYPARAKEKDEDEKTKVLPKPHQID